MRVLLTGHQGYLGTVMAPVLAAAGHEVVGLDAGLFADCVLGPTPADPPGVRVDLRDVTAEHVAGVDAVIHLAALSNAATVHVFLSLESARLGTPTGADGIQPRGFSEPLSEYVRHFLEMGGRLEVCSSCFEEYCRNLPKDERGRPALFEIRRNAHLRHRPRSSTGKR